MSLFFSKKYTNFKGVKRRWVVDLDFGSAFEKGSCQLTLNALEVIIHLNALAVFNEFVLHGRFAT